MYRYICNRYVLRAPMHATFVCLSTYLCIFIELISIHPSVPPAIQPSSAPALSLSLSLSRSFVRACLRSFIRSSLKLTEWPTWCLEYAKCRSSICSSCPTTCLLHVWEGLSVWALRFQDVCIRVRLRASAMSFREVRSNSLGLLGLGIGGTSAHEPLQFVS